MLREFNTQSEEEVMSGEDDTLFKLTMQHEWEEVKEKYKDKNFHEMKLTKTEDTALHIAISSYNSKISNLIHEDCIRGMISLMREWGSLMAVLEMKNVKGDTPLHLAAAVGWEAICKQIAAEDPKLITIRNGNGETPLFVAAHHGNLEAFCSLHEAYIARNGGEPDESLCRRKDGNTVLHSAISGQYFGLAHMIIEKYKNLQNYVNVDGETPLHVLARKPNIFKSSYQLGFYESLVYKCVLVDDLKKQPKDIPTANKNASTKKKFPDKCWTCVDIFFLLWDPIYKICRAGFSRSKSRSTDEEKQQYMEHGVPICENFLADCSRSKKQNVTPKDKNEVNKKEYSKDYGSFPPNYNTCISFSKFVATVILTILGIGFTKIRKIQEQKVRHYHAKKILNKLTESVPSYKYDNNGQRPVQPPESQHLEAFKYIPDSPPIAEEEDHNHQTQSADKKAKGVVKDTPLLVAARMGIPEMVKKILIAVPIAIQDEDCQGKNVLMVAAENRQTTVFDFLVKKNLPDYVYHHVDNEGNSILHLAAKLGEKMPWRIPGAALQMQWELKWYKHVKRSVPSLCFSHLNTKGETPQRIFSQTHEKLIEFGNEWLIKTSESCSVVAALIATVAFATSATVPGGLNQEHGYPTLRDHEAFDIFSIASLIALCLSITALVFFLAIITSRFEERDFKRDLPRKLLVGLTCLFSGIAAMLLSFCAGHTFILRENLRIVAAVPIYAAATMPVMFFAVAHLPLYFDLLWAACRKVPLRSYKVFHQ